MLVVGAIGSVVAGCTTTVAGTPNPVAVANTSSVPNDFGAPRVTSPLDGAPFVGRPCAVLTPAQLQALNLLSGKSDTNSAVARFGAPGCDWVNGDTREAVGAGFLVGNKNGLADTYRGKDKWARGYFVPTEVDGYPAVFNDSPDLRSRGTCGMTVGISDTLAFSLLVQGRRGEKSCDQVKQVASLVIQTIKSGG
ncbi:hypothetical protein AOZ06_14095 [Kibdelosporangium phytohabitans]|uniref:DUF3558 domain-containing protein n=1 Tax=Kibdelosporangium phytohabitans TaxID=860235 RepID=A0A0N7F381_9PSEU|nr:DUF3558 domain-containing protein [Kibdelosporangium phytohabitans]ALG07895.1 hypothetical protein AOZ06_14095 [Kibdelosporangium phytohabitans]